MKYLTTFLYGLLLLGIGTYLIALHNDFETFWDYLYVIVGFVFGVLGFDKLDRATI